MCCIAIDVVKINGATEVESISVKTGEVIKFADTSSGSPTSWLWQFPGGTPETSTEQNPTVYYTDDGVYDVSLTVGDGESTSSRTRTGFVTVTGVTPLAQILPPCNIPLPRNTAADGSAPRARTMDRLLNRIPHGLGMVDDRNRRKRLLSNNAFDRPKSESILSSDA